MKLLGIILSIIVIIPILSAVYNALWKTERGFCFMITAMIVWGYICVIFIV